MFIILQNTDVFIAENLRIADNRASDDAVYGIAEGGNIRLGSSSSSTVDITFENVEKCSFKELSPKYFRTLNSKVIECCEKSISSCYDEKLILLDELESKKKLKKEKISQLERDIVALRVELGKWQTEYDKMLSEAFAKWDELRSQGV